ncbi:F0F1 ATP synthase subunit B [Pelagibacterium xiamenense]|uniref:F0F1 ATP synthase subunit B n=1 Tax=Pelagibacterium xiamenense TaxID=2901140 RepID=UPI001E60A06C|nr:F0F1 ATP synthase subunit B [Pelagibacterium xiamenense]MCD7059262.1 F0F1 ATP synthase subunit B [Pelagibacterium xiamenense]
MARILIAQADGSEAELHVPAEDQIQFDEVGGDHSQPEGHVIEGTEAHGGGHTDVFPPFDASTFPSQILWLAISFAALYFIMSRIALPRIGEILEVRRDRIEGDLAEADRLRQKTDQAIASYEEALSDARSKAHEIAEKTRSEIKADLDAKRAKVEADLSKKMSAAEARIAETKTEALGHVDAIAAETAQALVGQLVGKVPVKAARDAVAKVTKE